MGKKRGFLGIREEDLDLSVMDEAMEKWIGTEEERMERLREADEICRKEEERFRKLYGDNWFMEYLKQCDILDTEEKHMKRINTAIYNGQYYCVMGFGMAEENRRQDRRMHELYGDRYAELKFHEEGDPRVKELMLRDALRTGKRNELPDCLVGEYDRMVSGGDAK